jgi:hypothetical protein
VSPSSDVGNDDFKPKSGRLRQKKPRMNTN